MSPAKSPKMASKVSAAKEGVIVDRGYQPYKGSYTPEAGWYVLGVPDVYTVGSSKGTDHASPYTYDTHVPLAFYGLPFRAGSYRTHAEPVDLAVTLASLLGINAPTHAVGRVLTRWPRCVGAAEPRLLRDVKRELACEGDYARAFARFVQS